MIHHRVALLAALALLVAGCSGGGGRTEDRSNRNEHRGSLALSDLRVARDAATGALSVSLRTFEAWPSDLLAVTGPNRLDVLFDTDADREEEAVARVVFVDGTLRVFLTSPGVDEREVPVVRPDGRTVAFALSGDSVLARSENLGVAALSGVPPAGSECEDACIKRLPEHGWATPSVLAGFTCTQVIGFSQTRQWYPQFETLAGDDRWQLMWSPGAVIEYWGSPAFGGWSHRIDSPCRDRSSDPDRVVLTISGLLHGGPSEWSNEIRQAIATIKSKYPELEQILLQPVIGGPDGEICFVGGDPVRASVNYPVIVQAIASVVGGDVRAGASPDAAACSDYLDAKGHLTSEAAIVVGRELAGYYAAVEGTT